MPDDFSGSVQSTHALIVALRQRGHECNVVASLPRRAKHFLATAVFKLSMRRFVLEWDDVICGYPVKRGACWRFVERVERAIKRDRPDVLVLDSLRMLAALSAAGYEPACPIVVIIHDPYFVNEANTLPFAGKVLIVANSPYTADIVSRHFGLAAPVVPPVVHLKDYQTTRPNPTYLTLVTPHPRKGLDLVLSIAEKIPQFSFLLVEGWPMDKHEWRQLEGRIQHLPNVKLRRSTSDMKEVYRDTWLLLVPSELETFGRVVIEAQVSGIPVVCKDVGALRWVVGEGGVVFAPDASVSEWVEELLRLHGNAGAYQKLSECACRNTARMDFQPDHVALDFEKSVKKFVTSTIEPQ